MRFQSPFLVENLVYIHICLSVWFGSYLVCGMFDEAKSLASSILKRLLENCNSSSKAYKFPEGFENDCADMLESAAMVLVQSMKHLQRYAVNCLNYFISFAYVGFVIIFLNRVQDLRNTEGA